MTISKQEATHHRDSDPREALQWINVTYERLLLRIPEPENKAGCLWCTDLFKLSTSTSEKMGVEIKVRSITEFFDKSDETFPESCNGI